MLNHFKEVGMLQFTKAFDTTTFNAIRARVGKQWYLTTCWNQMIIFSNDIIKTLGFLSLRILSIKSYKAFLTESINAAPQQNCIPMITATSTVRSVSQSGYNQCATEVSMAPQVRKRNGFTTPVRESSRSGTMIARLKLVSYPCVRRKSFCHAPCATEVCPIRANFCLDRLIRADFDLDSLIGAGLGRAP